MTTLNESGWQLIEERLVLASDDLFQRGNILSSADIQFQISTQCDSGERSGSGSCSKERTLTPLTVIISLEIDLVRPTPFDCKDLDRCSAIHCLVPHYHESVTATLCARIQLSAACYQGSALLRFCDSCYGTKCSMWLNKNSLNAAMLVDVSLSETALVNDNHASARMERTYDLRDFW